MPLPKPTESESRQKFVSRCMGDSVMRTEYSNQDQRAAICYNLYDRPAGKAIYTDSEFGDTILNCLKENDILN